MASQTDPSLAIILSNEAITA